MSPAIAVLGAGEDLELAGAPPGAAAGTVWCGGSEQAIDDLAGCELIIALGDADFPPTATGSRVRWLAGAAAPPPVTDTTSGVEPAERVIAQDGPGLWRRAPWPVSDSLFDLPPAPGSGRLLVVAPEPEGREAVARLEAHGVEAVTTGALTRRALEDAVGVLAIAASGEPTPAWLMAPLAARRVLLRVGGRPEFGLEAGIDHLVAQELGQAALLAAALVHEPGAFGSMRAFGALTAGRHRASSVYARMLADIRLERAPAPAGRRT